MTDIEEILDDIVTQACYNPGPFTYKQLAPGVLSVSRWSWGLPQAEPTHTLTLTVTPITPKGA